MRERLSSMPIEALLAKTLARLAMVVFPVKTMSLSTASVTTVSVTVLRMKGCMPLMSTLPHGSEGSIVAADIFEGL